MFIFMTPKWVRYFFHQGLHYLWRKKPLVLALVMVSTFVVVAIQYNSVNNHQKSHAGSERIGHRRFTLVGSASKNHRIYMPHRNLSAVNGAEEQVIKNNHNPNVNSDYKGRDLGAHDDSMKRQTGANFFDNKVIDANVKQGENGNRYVPALRLVHFDLKGAPPKISYLKQIFPLIKDAGANGILIEYEDMFPFWGPLEPIAAKNAYSKDDIQEILNLARLYDFEVIPLVQTFGHLEMALKLKEFKHLREDEKYPMAICPSKNASFNLVTGIIDQVMTMHSSAKYLHIGCDEVFHMAMCDKCRLFDREILFLNHVTRVAKYVLDKYSIRPIIWDDMLRNIPVERLKASNIGKLAEPMIWTYVKDVYRFVPYSTFLMFSEVFPNIWAASAFKGAFGETLTVPNVKMHLENNEAWLEVMKEQHKNFKNFRGIAVTGWQRYDHLATLCELLPAALPSLIVNLLTLSHGHYNATYVSSGFDKLMHCTRKRYYSSTPNQFDTELETDPNLWQRASGCDFPGNRIFQLTMDVNDAVKKVNDFVYDVTIHKAWMTDYNVRRNYSNPYRIEEGLQEHSAVRYRLTLLVKEAYEALGTVFDEYTVTEWIEQNIYPYITKMESIMKNAMEMKKVTTWERRPLKILPDLAKYFRPSSK